MGRGNVLPSGMYVHHVFAWCLKRPKESVRSPGNRVADDCHCHHHGYWESNPGPLKKQSMLLTTEPLLQNPNQT